MRQQKASKLWGRDQGQHERVDAYVTAIQKIAKSAGVHDDMLRYAIMRGLRKKIARSRDTVRCDDAVRPGRGSPNR